MVLPWLLREVENSEAPPALFQEKCSEWGGEGPAGDVKEETGYINQVLRGDAELEIYMLGP